MRILFVLLVMGSVLVSACAHRRVVEEVQAPVPAATPAPEVKTKIKYVYVKTPDTTSAMTIEPYERSEKPAKSLTAQIVQIFWPLLTLLAAGALMIVGLYFEHQILNRQLARRSKRVNQSA